MPHQEKISKDSHTQPVILLPITTTLFVRKTVSKTPESNMLDFHLEVIKKIDKILADHDQENPPAEITPTPPLNPPSPPTPIEPRPPLNKNIPHEELLWQPSIESLQNNTSVLPEEFKSEVSFHPEFRFITSREFSDIITQRPSSENRIEIIDCNPLLHDDVALQESNNIISSKNENDILSTQPFRFNESHHRKKIEIIDMRTMKQKKIDHVFNASEEQAEQIDQKAQLYFLNKKESSEKKQWKLDNVQTDDPDILEEQSKELRKKLIEEEKKLKQLEQEYERLEQMEKKKTIVVEKKHTQNEKSNTKKDQQKPRSKREFKKQEQEQKRLKRLQIRQARLEDRRRKKLEKQALKLKQKQQRLKMKGVKPQHKINEGRLKTDVQQSALLFDEDLIKVLHMTDSLLGELPEEVLNDFIESKDYKLYEKVMNKYKIK